MSQIEIYSRLTLRIRRVEFDVGWNDAVLQCQYGLDQTCHARRAFGVTHIGLDRANVNTRSTKHFAHRGCFKGVAGCCSCPMTLKCVSI